MNNLSTFDGSNDIAIIGIVGRFPGAKNIDEFWQNLQNGVETISFFSDSELEVSEVHLSTLKERNYVKAGGVLENIELFDASFFGFNPRECEIMDPQHRLFLECAWEVLESTGYDPERYEGKIGVYAGVGINTYFLNNLTSNRSLIQSVSNMQIRIGNSSDFVPTLVSYKLNLKGTSVNVQTSCSSSLVAVHLACQTLLNGECDMTLVGGVSIVVPQKVGYFYQEGGIYSPDGHCKAFDYLSQGTVRGNGVGIVVLKRLADAISDGDYIHAIIKGSAVNNDGSSKVAYTAPSVNGQAEVITEALAMARVDPETVTYVEAHGTGTSLGDPIEIAALTQAFRTSTEAKNFCAIGSVKTNIGHLDAAAGIASLIKTVLMLKNKSLPPSLHFKQPNPKIDFVNSPFYVKSSLSPWKVDQHIRRAGVSSFGVGGTNAHVVLEEAPIIESSSKSRPWHLLVLSAKTISALETLTVNLTDHLKKHSDINLADIAYTYQVGRRTFPYRRMLVCHDINDAVNTLVTQDPKRVLTVFEERTHRSIAFMFPGQTAQYVNMALELYQLESVFREQVNFCAEYIKPHLDLDLRDIIFPNKEYIQEAAQQLNQTFITQPALFIIEYALARLWMSWGLHPEAMIGHSIGEYVAACIAGVFSLEDALTLVVVRGRLMQQLPHGAMLAVPLPEAKVRPLLGKQLSIAAFNAPSLCVVSGQTEVVEKLQDTLAEKGIVCRRLKTSHAFHSHMMEPIIKPFLEHLHKVKLKAPNIPFVSNISGTWIKTAEATDPNYWAQQLRQPVRFSEGITKLLNQSERILLEIGPGQMLSTLARQHQQGEQAVISSLRHPQEQQSDIEVLFKALGQLWLMGVQIDWSSFYTQEQRQRLPLPTYPFERQRYWIEPQQINNIDTFQFLSSKKPDIADWFYIPSWKRSAQPQTSKQRNLVDEKQWWLVFIDTFGLGAQIVKQLEQKNQNVITVTIGKQFTKLSENKYSINPEQSNEHDALIKELYELGKIPKVIVHLWSITANETVNSAVDFFEKCQNLGFYSLLFLTQALTKQRLIDAIQIRVLSNGICEVTGEEVLFPEKTTALGLCKVIPQEHPYITCQSIDVILPKSGSKQEEKLVNQIIAELYTEPFDLTIAYRRNHRWVQIFEAKRLEEPIDRTTRLRQRGIYLITGGLGNIGLLLAEYLARTVRAKLVLTGHSTFPERDEWQRWLETHDELDGVSRKIQKLQIIEELGAEVMVVSADIANQEQMQKVIAQAYERFGEIHGVIHAAGIVGENSLCSIQKIGRAECELHYQPKVRGLFVLEKVLQGKKLDFCVLQSSLSSILGGLGFSACAAANVFMDAFAHKHNQISTIPWISMNWDGWQFGKKEQNASVGATVVELAVTPEEGIEAFERALFSSLLNQIIISTGDLQTRINHWVKLDSLQNTEHSKRDSSSRHPRPNLPNVYVAPRNELEQTVANIWQELFNIKQIGIHDNFFDLGGHSLLGIQLASRLREIFQVELPLCHLFEMLTIAEISSEIERIKDTGSELREPSIVPLSREAHLVKLSTLMKDAGT